MKKIIFAILIFSMLFSMNIFIFAKNGTKTEAEKMNQVFNSTDNFDARSVVLMEASTGKIIFAKNENGAYSPASVTKIMTLLLVAEALNNGNFALEDKVMISDYAASMGGSQVFLKEGETITVEELIKCAVIASANDAAVALAELVAGSESVFVEKMNSKAKELGLKNTNFENVTGLDDDTVNHVTSAMDIAIMSKELIKYDIILKYSSLWQDSIRDGEFILTNTNRLVRYYNGCNGLKTGSTDKAGYCISVTAKRDGMQLIAVVMGAKSSNERNEIAKELLDYGFATYTLYNEEETLIEEVPITFGMKDITKLYSAPFCILVSKSDIWRIEKIYTIPECIVAPITKNSAVGKVEYMLDGEKIGESEIYSNEDIAKITFFELFTRIIFDVLHK